jgi:hypothetical protein
VACEPQGDSPPPQTPHTARSRDLAAGTETDPATTRPAATPKLAHTGTGPRNCPSTPSPVLRHRPRPRPTGHHDRYHRADQRQRRFMSAATAPDRPAPPHRCSCPHHDRPPERTPPGEHTDHRQQLADRVAARAEAVRDAANPRRATGIQTAPGTSDAWSSSRSCATTRSPAGRHRHHPPHPARLFPGDPHPGRPWTSTPQNALRRSVTSPRWLQAGESVILYGPVGGRRNTWPRQPERQDGEPVLREPHGIVHHYAPLYRTP